MMIRMALERVMLHRRMSCRRRGVTLLEGLRLFAEHTLVFDYPNERFAIIAPR